MFTKAEVEAGIEQRTCLLGLAAETVDYDLRGERPADAQHVVDASHAVDDERFLHSLGYAALGFEHLGLEFKGEGHAVQSQRAANAIPSVCGTGGYRMRRASQRAAPRRASC